MPQEGWVPTFITFNYDRFLDYRLFNYCKRCWVKSSDDRTLTAHEIYAFMTSHFRIYHIFGQLDLMPGQEEDVEGRAFSPEVGSNGPRGVVESIKTTYLDVSIDQQFKSYIDVIRSEIKKAERLIFLGFGFDDFNFSNILGMKQIYENFDGGLLKEVYMTNIDLGQGTINELRRIFNNAKNKSYSDLGDCLIKNDIEKKEFNCSKLLNFI